MIVFVAGMPRAGSMWTYNIVRALFKSKKYIALPKVIPVHESNLIAEALSSGVEDNVVYCVKTHRRLINPLPTQHDVKIICNIRDVRDACLSYMRFMRADFDTGMKAMVGMMETTDYYVNSFKDNLLAIRYEDISKIPLDTINSICDFLELSVSEKKKIDIETDFSKSTIKKSLNKLSDIKIGNNGVVKGVKYQEKYDVVGNFDGTYRVFDKSTSFQSNHITSKNDGEWKEYFSENQIEQVLSISKEWLLKYEYII